MSSYPGSRRRVPSCSSCRQRSAGALCRLGRPDIERLERSKTSNSYRRGQIVFFEGNPPFGAYCIFSGRVGLYRTGEDGRSQMVRIAGPGELLGIEALLTRRPFEATAEALEDCVLCFFDKAALLRLLEENRTLALETARTLSRSLLKTQEALHDLTRLPASARLARLLLELDATLQTGRPMRLSRRILAETIGVAPETTIRIISDFKIRGYISAKGQRITVVDRQALETLLKPA